MTEFEQQIIQEYQDGNSINVLSKKYPNISYSKIQKILNSNNIPIRGGRKKISLTKELFLEFKNDFEQGLTYKQLEEKYNISFRIVSRLITENKLQRQIDPRKKINKNLMVNYFTNIDSAEKAYWLGLLFTDGSVDKYKSTGRIRLLLQEQDRDILNKFKQSLLIDSKIIEDKRPNSTCLSVEINCEPMFNDLAKFGIVPRKTYETTLIDFSLLPSQFIPAFLLGLFDGDGSLSYSEDCSKDVTINFTSYHLSIAQDFQLAIDKLINKEKHNKLIYTSAWHAIWRGRLLCLLILDILYKNCPLHLNRKYNKYLQLKNSLE